MRLIFLLFGLVRLVLTGLFAPLGALIERLSHTPEPDTFRDHARRRTIPYRLYEPQDTEGPAPVVLFSHGMGGTRDAAPYLGQALAAAGYWGIFLQHPGSDAEALGGLRGATSQTQARERIRRTMLDPKARMDRYADVGFVLNELQRLNTKPGGRFEGRLDLDRIGMAGHSYGARATLAAAGQRQPGAGLRFRDTRVKAGLLLSPSGARMPGQTEATLPPEDFAQVTIPLLHVTGTRDSNPDMRVLPYKAIGAPGQYLLVLENATHGDLSAAHHTSELQEGPGPERPRITRTVALAAVLFFDAYLKGNKAARIALRDGLPAELKPGDRYDFK